MRGSSVRLRLLGAAGAAIVLALVTSGLGLEYLFERHVERRAADELRTDLRALLANFKIDDVGNLSFTRTLSDQRYHQVLSGLYWQVSRDGDVVGKSRSLWDEQLLPPGTIQPAGGDRRQKFAGPRGHEVLAVEKAISVARGAKTFIFRAIVAIDAGELVTAVRAFRFDLWLGLAALAGTLLATFWIALGVGLAPLAHMRTALGLLRSGQASRLAGEYPAEVQPLADDLNELLAQQESMIARAQSRASNLAHGLKTPLTAISAMAEELDGDGESEIARELQLHVATMQRHLEHELTLAKTALGMTSAPPVRLLDHVTRLVRTMKRLPHGANINWEIDIDQAVALAIDETTIGEIVGNILDNARKWAKGTARVSATLGSDWIELNFSDDGPGVPASKRRSIADRGRRLDETRPGTGLGMSIVSDIVEQIGGEIELGEAPLGGLAVSIRLPSRLARRQD